MEILEDYLKPVLRVKRIHVEQDGLGKLFGGQCRRKRFQAETAAELDALLPAILARAFKGEL